MVDLQYRNTLFAHNRSWNCICHQNNIFRLLYRFLQCCIGTESIPAVYQIDSLCHACQIQGISQRRIAAADDCHCLSLIERTIAGGTIRHARQFRTRHIQLSVGCAGSIDHALCRNSRTICQCDLKHAVLLGQPLYIIFAN